MTKQSHGSSPATISPHILVEDEKIALKITPVPHLLFFFLYFFGFIPPVFGSTGVLEGEKKEIMTFD